MSTAIHISSPLIFIATQSKFYHPLFRDEKTGGSERLGDSPNIAQLVGETAKI